MEGESVEKEIHRKTSWKKGGERVRGKEREKGGHGGRWDGRDPIEVQREEKPRWFCGEKESEGEVGESRKERGRGREGGRGEGGGETRRNRHGEEGKLTERRMSRGGESGSVTEEDQCTPRTLRIPLPSSPSVSSVQGYSPPWISRSPCNASSSKHDGTSPSSSSSSSSSSLRSRRSRRRRLRRWNAERRGKGERERET